MSWQAPMPPASIVTPSAISTATPVYIGTPAPVSTLDSIVKLTKQFSELALAIQANMQSRPPTVNASNAAVAAPVSRPCHCMWYDSIDHTRRECSEFTDALHSQRITLNKRGWVMFNAEELPLM
jgi:hypothetical protein